MLLGIALALITVFSIALKIAVLSTKAAPQPYAGLGGLLQQEGYQLTSADSSFWINAVAGGCTVSVVNAAPQGWHAAMIARNAGGRELTYVYRGQTYPEQPVFAAMIDLYLARLARALGFKQENHPVMAIIGPAPCASQLASKLAAAGV